MDVTTGTTRTSGNDENDENDGGGTSPGASYCHYLAFAIAESSALAKTSNGCAPLNP